MKLREMLKTRQLFVPVCMTAYRRKQPARQGIWQCC